MSETTIKEEYTNDVFSLKQHLGLNFTKNFIKDFELENLVQKISDLTKKSMENYNRTPVVAFCSEKGGCGKTTTSVVVAQAVANMGFKVLLIDADQAHSASEIINTRKALISSEIAAAEQHDIPVADVLDYKYSTEPTLDALSVSTDNFNASFVQEIATKKDYDLIVIDTAGVRPEEAANFDIRDIQLAGKPHITASYISNAIVIPTQTSNIDLNRMIAFTQPLMVFLGTLHAIKRNIVKTQYRVLPNKVEKSGSGLVELDLAKEEVPFNWFNQSIRRSLKIPANTSTRHANTIFSNKTVRQIIVSYLNVVDEIYSDVAESLEK